MFFCDGIGTQITVLDYGSDSILGSSEIAQFYFRFLKEK